MTVSIDQAVTNFVAKATSDSEIELAQLKGKSVVLYFYPKDNTPGCTTQAQGFRDHFAEFNDHNCVILGVSKDSLKSHENFRQKYQLPFELISDPEAELCEQFAVFKQKSMFGKSYMGIERSTFLIDADGVLRKEWRKVKVKGHVDEVLEAVKAIK